MKWDGVSGSALASELAEARKRIAELEAENARLREALQPFKALADEIEYCAAQYPEGAPERDPDCWMKSCTWPDLVRAREALKKTK